MTIGLVIVTFDAAPFIERCLAAVASQTRRPDRVLVVDNHSRDDTRARVERASASLGLHVELLARSSNVGFAAANNLGVAVLEGCDWIGLLNPDAFPETGWLAALEAAVLRHPDAGSLAARLMRDGSPGLMDGAGDVYHVSGLVWRHGHGRALGDVAGAQVEQPVFAACAAAALYRRDAWIEAGGLDERFFCYVEDVDLGFRLQLAGHPCWYVPDAVAAHVGSATAGVGSAFSVYHGHRNLVWAFVKNMPGALVWRYLPAHVVMTLVALAWFTLKGRAGAIARAKWDGLRGLRHALRDRRRVQAGRRVSVPALRARLDRSSLTARLLAGRRRPSANDD